EQPELHADILLPAPCSHPSSLARHAAAAPCWCRSFGSGKPPRSPNRRRARDRRTAPGYYLATGAYGSRLLTGRRRSRTGEGGPPRGVVAVGVGGAEGDDEAVGRVAQDHLTVHRQRCAHERVHRCVDLAVGDLVIPIL